MFHEDSLIYFFHDSAWLSLVTFPANEEAVVLRVKNQESLRGIEPSEYDAAIHTDNVSEEWIASSHYDKNTSSVLYAIDKAIKVLIQ